MDFSYFIISIAVLLPGFIAFRTFKRFSYVQKIPSFEYTLHSIFYSILIWFLIVSLFLLIKPLREIEFLNLSVSYILNNNFSSFEIENLFCILIFFISVYLLSFVFGFSAGFLYFKHREKFNRKYTNIFQRSYYPTAWDEIFETLIYGKEFEDKIILIKTISQEYFIGEVRLISNAETDKSVYFSKVQKYDTTNKTFLEVAANYGFFISSKNIEYIHILPDVEEFDFDNYCKNEEIALELEKIKK